ncbi:MAG: tRNA (N6-isopentenyl adenosine(37)-C2)-methylthiotransferase MiaB [Candidatus Krumholzibacteria bacterium]|nr:tRNA (N6-isopentenyl adenosine(37)-C2)-methylthiotransferase MiaB [Candidatus Krumholzibacteria bacterium]
MATFQGDLPDLTQKPEPVGENLASVYIETYGCQMNVYDSQAINGLLEDAGFNIVQHDLEADVILLNTCSVRDLAEHKVVSRVGELRHRRLKTELPQPVVGICGCMAERMGTDLRKGQRKVDLVVGVDNYDTLPGLLTKLTAKTLPKSANRERTVTGHRTDAHYVAPPSLYPINNSHLVTIHKGCDYKCTYCIVPYTRGPQSEKSPAAIIQEISGIVAGGGREVTLLGQNVTAYNWQQGMDFAKLLEEVAEIDGLQRIRFLTGHPTDMHPHLMDTIGRLDKVCPWLHVPVQSGNDRILRRMKRLYTSAQYMEMVEYAHKVIPDVTFSTDFIVGFPGETEADFQDTLEIARKVKYDQAFSFKYSERPGVPAAKLDDDVSNTEKKRRLAELMAVQEETWNAAAENCVGQIWSGVLEGPARRQDNSAQGPSWRLRTANNRKIILQGGDYEVGDELTARITGYKNTSFLGKVQD